MAQSVSTNGYTETEVLSALYAPSVEFRFRHALLDPMNHVIRYLDGVTEGQIRNDVEAQLKRSYTVSIDTSFGGEINTLLQRFQPWIGLVMPRFGDDKSNLAWWPQGIFYATGDPKSVTENGQTIMTVTAYDRLTTLDDSQLANTYSVPAGKAVTTAITDFLEFIGAGPYNITPSTETTKDVKVWDAGTSRLTVLYELLGLISYVTYVDHNDVIVAIPWDDPLSRPADYSFPVGALSIVSREADIVSDAHNVPNHLVMYATTVNNENQAALVVNEVQLVLIFNVEVGATFDVTFNGDTSSGNPVAGLSGPVLASILESLPSIGSGNVGGTGTLAFNDIRITFIGDLGGQDVPLLDFSGSGCTISATEFIKGTGGGGGGSTAGRAEAFNTNPESRTSTVGRGRVITRVVKDVEATSQITLQDKCNRELLRLSQIDELSDRKSLPVPWLGMRDILGVAAPGSPAVEKFESLRYEIELRAGVLMTHHLRRVVSLN